MNQQEVGFYIASGGVIDRYQECEACHEPMYFRCKDGVPYEAFCQYAPCVECLKPVALR